MGGSQSNTKEKAGNKQQNDPVSQMEECTKAIHSIIEQNESEIQQKIGNHKKKCFENSYEQADNYVQCCKDLDKNIQSAMLNFQYKLIYYSDKSSQCYQNQQKNQQDYEFCKNDTLGNVRRLTQETLNIIEQ